MNDNDIAGAIGALAEAVRLISHGPLNGPGAQPMGIEALTMAVAEGFERVAQAQYDGLELVAGAIRDTSTAEWRLKQEDRERLLKAMQEVLR